MNATTWYDVCAVEAIGPDSGVCALVDGQQVAIFRLAGGDRLFALDNFDPFGKAQVLSRGIVGDAKGVAKVASPLHKQSFALATGQCLDDDQVCIATNPVRDRGGMVQVAIPRPRQ
jgi:nitrite reductase (NADH) small subunit